MRALRHIHGVPPALHHIHGVLPAPTAAPMVLLAPLMAALHRMDGPAPALPHIHGAAPVCIVALMVRPAHPPTALPAPTTTGHAALPNLGDLPLPAIRSQATGIRAQRHLGRQTTHHLAIHPPATHRPATHGGANLHQATHRRAVRRPATHHGTTHLVKNTTAIHGRALDKPAALNRCLGLIPRHTQAASVLRQHGQAPVVARRGPSHHSLHMSTAAHRRLVPTSVWIR